MFWIDIETAFKQHWLNVVVTSLPDLAEQHWDNVHTTLPECCFNVAPQHWGIMNFKKQSSVNPHSFVWMQYIHPRSTVYSLSQSSSAVAQQTDIIILWFSITSYQQLGKNCHHNWSGQSGSPQDNLGGCLQSWSFIGRNRWKWGNVNPRSQISNNWAAAVGRH